MSALAQAEINRILVDAERRPSSLHEVLGEQATYDLGLKVWECLETLPRSAKQRIIEGDFAPTFAMPLLADIYDDPRLKPHQTLASDHISAIFLVNAIKSDADKPDLVRVWPLSRLNKSLEMIFTLSADSRPEERSLFVKAFASIGEKAGDAAEKDAVREQKARFLELRISPRSSAATKELVKSLGQSIDIPIEPKTGSVQRIASKVGQKIVDLKLIRRGSQLTAGGMAAGLMIGLPATAARADTGNATVATTPTGEAPTSANTAASASNAGVESFNAQTVADPAVSPAEVAAATPPALIKPQPSSPAIASPAPSASPSITEQAPPAGSTDPNANASPDAAPSIDPNAPAQEVVPPADGLAIAPDTISPTAPTTPAESPSQNVAPTVPPATNQDPTITSPDTIQPTSPSTTPSTQNPGSEITPAQPDQMTIEQERANQLLSDFQSGYQADSIAVLLGGQANTSNPKDKMPPFLHDTVGGMVTNLTNALNNDPEEVRIAANEWKTRIISLSLQGIYSADQQNMIGDVESAAGALEIGGNQAAADQLRAIAADSLVMTRLEADPNLYADFTNPQTQTIKPPTSNPESPSPSASPEAPGTLDMSNLGILEGKLSSEQLKHLQENYPFYREVERLTGVPAAVQVAMHYRETGLSRTNPGNGQGLFQLFSLGQRFTPGEVTSDAEFKRQLIMAANFLKMKARGMGFELNAHSTDTEIKAVLWAYNGKANIYTLQGENRGFALTDVNGVPIAGPEGSPYVMNYADPSRTPGATNWRQIVSDNGKIGPAGVQLGAYIVFNQIRTMEQSTSTKPSSHESALQHDATIRSIVVKKAESQIGVHEQPNGCDHGNPSVYGSCGAAVDKFTQGILEYWCADFASWDLNQAGIPVTGSSKNWKENAVSNFRKDFLQINGYHPKGHYSPRVGDIAFYANDGHIGIVTHVFNGFVTIVSGNTWTNDNGSGHAVAVHTYRVGSPELAGFGDLSALIAADNA